MARERDPDRQLRLFAFGPYSVPGSGSDSDSGSRSAGNDGLDPDRWKPVISDFGTLLVSVYLSGSARANSGG